MRQTFETEKDRENERQLAAFLSSKVGLQARKMPSFYEIDFALTRADGEIAGFIEFKARAHRWGQFPTLMLSMHKIMAGYRWSRTCNVPFFIFVRDGDGKYLFWRYQRGRGTFRFGGRTTQARDSQDAEPCEYIPCRLFTELSQSGIWLLREVLNQEREAA